MPDPERKDVARQFGVQFFFEPLCIDHPVSVLSNTGMRRQ
jgi:hypothetical protein